MQDGAERPRLMREYCERVRAVIRGDRWPGMIASEKLLLILLNDYANSRNRLAWPALATLGKLMGMSERNVRKILRRLTERGCIRCVGKGPALTRMYFIEDPRPLEGGTPVPPRAEPRVPGVKGSGGNRSSDSGEPQGRAGGPPVPPIEVERGEERSPVICATVVAPWGQELPADNPRAVQRAIEARVTAVRTANGKKRYPANGLDTRDLCRAVRNAVALRRVSDLLATADRAALWADGGAGIGEAFYRAGLLGEV